MFSMLDRSLPSILSPSGSSPFATGPRVFLKKYVQGGRAGGDSLRAVRGVQPLGEAGVRHGVKEK